MDIKSTPPSSNYRYVLKGLQLIIALLSVRLCHKYNMYDGYILYSLNGVHTYVFEHTPKNH